MTALERAADRWGGAAKLYEGDRLASEARKPGARADRLYEEALRTFTTSPSGLQISTSWAGSLSSDPAADAKRFLGCATREIAETESYMFSVPPNAPLKDPA